MIDAKRYKGKIEVHTPLFGKPKLKIAGRDRTTLIHGLDKQVGIVKTALSAVGGEVPVLGCLCFLTPEGLLADSGLPVLRTLRVEGYPLYYPRRLAKRLNQDGPVSAERAERIHRSLAEVLTPA